MANPILQSTGTTDWINNDNTWRAEDAEWLQARSVIRKATFGAASTPAHESVGSVAYQTDDDTLGVYDGSSWLRVPAAEWIDTGTDTSASVVIKHLSAGSGLALSSAGLATVSNLTVSSTATVPNITMSSVTMVSSGNDLTVGGSSGTVTFENKDVLVEQAFEVDGVSDFDGTVNINAGGTANTFTVSGVLNANGGLSGTTGTFSSAISASSATIGTTTKIDGSGVYKDGEADRGFLITGSDDITLSVPTGGEIILDDGSVSTSRVAGFVVSNSPPSTDYPEGTVWFEVP